MQQARRITARRTEYSVRTIRTTDYGLRACSCRFDALASRLETSGKKGVTGNFLTWTKFTAKETTTPSLSRPDADGNSLGQIIRYSIASHLVFFLSGQLARCANQTFLSPVTGAADNSPRSAQPLQRDILIVSDFHSPFTASGCKSTASRALPPTQAAVPSHVGAQHMHVRPDYGVRQQYGSFIGCQRLMRS